MNDIYVTLTGNVAAPPRQHTFPDGSRVTSLKVASTSRYFDRENQQWRNGDTTYFGVRCFRGLADNVAQSIHLGQPIVVQGRLRIREFTHEGERRLRRWRPTRSDMTFAGGSGASPSHSGVGLLWHWAGRSGAKPTARRSTGRWAVRPPGRKATPGHWPW